MCAHKTTKSLNATPNSLFVALIFKILLLRSWVDHLCLCQHCLSALVLCCLIVKHLDEQLYHLSFHFGRVNNTNSFSSCKQCVYHLISHYTLHSLLLMMQHSVYLELEANLTQLKFQINKYAPFNYAKIIFS